jgi:hypothetical protein
MFNTDQTFLLASHYMPRYNTLSHFLAAYVPLTSFRCCWHSSIIVCRKQRHVSVCIFMMPGNQFVGNLSPLPQIIRRYTAFSSSRGTRENSSRFGRCRAIIGRSWRKKWRRCWCKVLTDASLIFRPVSANQQGPGTRGGDGCLADVGDA